MSIPTLGLNSMRVTLRWYGTRTIFFIDNHAYTNINLWHKRMVTVLGVEYADKHKAHAESYVALIEGSGSK